MFIRTGRNVHFLEMQIGADSSYVVTLTLNLTLDILNPKSVGFDIVSRTTNMPSFKSF